MDRAKPFYWAPDQTAISTGLPCRRVGPAVLELDRYQTRRQFRTRPNRFSRSMPAAFRLEMASGAFATPRECGEKAQGGTRSGGPTDGEARSRRSPSVSAAS